MEIEKFSFIKNFNRDLIAEQVAVLALSQPVSSPHLAGFVSLTRRVLQPATDPVPINTNKGTVTDSADPGEIRLNVETALSDPDRTLLSNAFTTHDSTQSSIEQQREDKDEIGFPLLLEDLERTSWEAVPGNQQAINAAHIEILRRAVQFLLRGNETDNVDTDD